MAVLLKLGCTGWFLLFITAGSSPAFSQISHRNALVNIALSCFTPVLSGSSAIQIQASDRSDIISPGVEQGLLSRGFTISTESGKAKLVYDVELAQVVLENAAQNQLTRRVTLGLNYQVLGSGDGEETLSTVLNSGTCSDSTTDLIEREMASKLAYDGFSVTNPAIPPKKGITRYIQPLILIAASAVGTYLFFNLRSRRADSR
ncbi:MAG: hypothetical protein O3B41_07835 [Bacteroidetes bacterium]|nr:hypothetical protein [Bacteroidota bacterium]